MSTSLVCRRGFTLIEVLVALILIVLGLGGLDGIATATVRRMRITAQEATAVRLVQNRTEQILATACAASSGIDSSGEVFSTWRAATSGSLAHIDQVTHVKTIFGDHVETYRTIGACR